MRQFLGQTIDELLAHSGFLNLLMVFCRSVHGKLRFNRYDRSYDVRDLHGDVCEKMVKTMNRAKDMNKDILRPENIPDEKALFRWVYVLVLNRGLSKLRELKRRPQLTENPDEDFKIMDPAPGPERRLAGRELMGFTNDLRPERRSALMLWLADYSYRDIATILNKKGIKCSHVTVQKWIGDSLKFIARRAS
jgi:DNA-directed RNA polymerase specialized sigma24 family protein